MSISLYLLYWPSSYLYTNERKKREKEKRETDRKRERERFSDRQSIIAEKSPLFSFKPLNAIEIVHIHEYLYNFPRKVSVHYL